MSDVFSVEHVTDCLRRASQGDVVARGEAFRIFEAQLRRIAESRLRGEGSGMTLQATCLVDDAFLKLINNPNVLWQDRRQFLVYAADVMRQILIDHARGRQAQKRGAGVRPAQLADLNEPAVDDGNPADILQNHEKVLAVDRALSQLKESHPELAEVVVLNFFGGYSLAQIGEQVLNLPASTVRGRWAQAKVLLYRLLAQTESLD